MGSETNNTNSNEGKAITQQICKITSAYYDPVDIDSKSLKQGDRITQETIVIRMSPQFTGYYGYGRWNKMIREHTGYDYIASVGTPVKAVQSGYIERVRFGRKPIEYYFEKKDEQRYYKKKWFTCPFYELFKKGTYFFDQSICNECRNKYFTYSETNPPKDYKDWKTYQIISEKIIGPRIEMSTIDIVEKTIKKRINWNRISEGCFGVQVWLKIRNFVTNDTGYYAYYAHLSELNLEFFLSLAFSKLDNSKTEKAGETTVLFDTPIQVKAGDVIGKSGCTGNALNMEGNNQHLHFECRKGDGEANQHITPNKIVKTEFQIKYTKYDKVPSSYKDYVQEFIEKIETKDIIEYRASEKWLKGVSKGYNLEYINMRKQQEKANNPKITDDDFNQNIKPKILNEKKGPWEAWFEYKEYKINEEEQNWKIIKKDPASKDALVTFRKEHVLVVGNIKGTEKGSNIVVAKQ